MRLNKTRTLSYAKCSSFNIENVRVSLCYCHHHHHHVVVVVVVVVVLLLLQSCHNQADYFCRFEHIFIWYVCHYGYVRLCNT